MKKFLKRFLIFTLSLFILSSCSKNSNEKIQKKDLKVFCAASLTETMEEIKKIYEQQNENINLIYTFDSSGTLKKQIEQGVDVDIFFSAAQKQMDQLSTDKNDFIDKSTRFDILENKVVLAVAEGNPEKIEKFEDLTRHDISKIALGNSDVPVGQYSEELLKNLGIFEKIKENVSFGSNVKEVTTWVKQKVSSCGIIYSTDAYSAGLEVVDTADKTELNTQVLYPVAVLKNSKMKDESKKFLEFLKTDTCKKIFEKVGFTPVK